MKKKIINDVLLNILALAISTVILQLIIYPTISANVSISSFGKILTIMGGVNVISVVLGGSLNNAQLVNQKIYKEEKYFYGDFKFMARIYFFIFLVMYVVAMLFPLINLNLLGKIQLLILILLTSLRAYLPVFWRIKLNYKLIMWHSVFTATGYIIGSLVFSHTKDNWLITFLVGEIFSFLFLLKNTQFLSYKVTKSQNFKKINRDFLNLFSSNIVANILTYFDRFLLQALLGPTEVSIYFAASIFGKLSSMVLQPISGVFLSYLSRENSDKKKKYYLYFLLASIGFGVMLFCISLIFSPIFVNILYKNLYVEAKQYMTLANLSTIILITGSLLQPVLLRFSNLVWQNIIQLVYAASFIILGYLLMKSYGMMGFVIASLVSNSIRFILFVIVGYFSIWRNEDD
ncbi:hypothetical protein ACOYX3_10855 [Enterococcus entomosocium]|uniref:hypothetical protein n=1 Tax=Enterococcus entomosocium TaxID=3034352 RepID=UPI003BE4EE24